jgi:hypothetical protein
MEVKHGLWQRWILTLQRGVTSTACHSENITCRGVTSTARHSENITCRGVTITARHSENITCRGVTSTAHHAALSHSTISRQHREKMWSGWFVPVHKRAGSLMVWQTVPTNYCFIFFSPLEVWVFFLQPLISQAALWVSGTRKWNMKRMLLLSSRSWGL